MGDFQGNVGLLTVDDNREIECTPPKETPFPFFVPLLMGSVRICTHPAR